MINSALTLATKGYLSTPISLVSKGILLIQIEQGEITPQKPIGSGFSGQQIPKKYYIKVTFNYNNEIYTDIKETNKNIKVNANNIDIEIIDNKPVVTISVLD